MPKIRIIKSAVDALAAQERDTLWWDSSLVGFGIKVTPKGRKTYVVDYRMPGRRKPNRFTIGPHGSPWTTDEARKKASLILLGVSQGIDPNAEKRRRRVEKVDYSFGAYADLFAANYLRPNWPGSHDRAESVLRRHAKPFFKSIDIRDITKRDCATFMDTLMPLEATARKAAEVVGKMFRWAEDRGDLERSPMERVPRPKPSPGRERVLRDDELRAVWIAAGEMTHPFGELVRMLILTGQRRGELGGMRWEELHLDRRVWEVPASRTKSGREHVTPLTDMMIEVVEGLPRIGSLVFTVTGENQLGNHSKLKTKLDATIARASGAHEALNHWTLHDLRRTVATGLERLGFDGQLIELTQGRTKKLGAGQRYQRYGFLDEKRAALAAWSSYVEALLVPQPDRSTQLALEAVGK